MERLTVAPRGTSRRIAEDLRDRIQRGDLRPGQIAPSEMQLVEQYGVSRGTVRNAFASLAEDGLIEVVPGVGRRVSGVSEDNPPNAMSKYERIAVDIRERIRDGDFLPDEPLPSESALMEQYAVSRNTVRRAYRVLRDSGVVVIRHGEGAFPV
ncbi:GntR family transcriptional regulator [Pseudonocardia sp. ICBG1122]|nr:GntR family transcriptional regulator [Pseudonocardia pini]